MGVAAWQAGRGRGVYARGALLSELLGACYK
jgi:hypothetical protein